MWSTAFNPGLRHHIVSEIFLFASFFSESNFCAVGPLYFRKHFVTFAVKKCNSKIQLIQHFWHRLIANLTSFNLIWDLGIYDLKQTRYYSAWTWDLSKGEWNHRMHDSYSTDKYHRKKVCLSIYIQWIVQLQKTEARSKSKPRICLHVYGGQLIS